MRAIEAVDRADVHPALRRALVPAVYVLGVVMSLAIASTIPPAGRSEAFSMLFFALALAAPSFATAGERTKKRVRWMVAWLYLACTSLLTYGIVGVEILVLR